MDESKPTHIDTEFLALLASMGIEGDKKKAFVSLPADQKTSMINAYRRTAKADAAGIVKKIVAVKRHFATKYTISEIEKCVEVLGKARLEMSTLTEEDIEVAAENRIVQEVWEIITMLAPATWSKKSQTYIISIHETKQDRPIYKILEPAVKLFKMLVKSPAVIKYIKQHRSVFVSVFEVFPSQYIEISEMALEIASKTMDVHHECVLDHIMATKEKSEHVVCVPLCDMRVKYIIDEVYYNMSLENVTSEFITQFLAVITALYNVSPLTGIMVDSTLRMADVSRLLNKIKQKSADDKRVEHKAAIDRLIAVQEASREMATKIDVRKMEGSAVPKETKEDLDCVMNAVSVLYQINSSRIYDVLQYIRGSVLEEAKCKNKDKTKVEQERSIRVSQVKEIKEQNKCICQGYTSTSVGESVNNKTSTTNSAVQSKDSAERNVKDSQEKSAEKGTDKSVEVVEPSSTRQESHTSHTSPVVVASETVRPKVPMAPPMVPPVGRVSSIKSSIIPAPPMFGNKLRTPVPVMDESANKHENTKPSVCAPPPLPNKGSVCMPPPLPNKAGMMPQSVPPMPPMPGRPGVAPPSMIPGMPMAPMANRTGMMPPPMAAAVETKGPRAFYIERAKELHPENAQNMKIELHQRKPEKKGIWDTLDKQELDMFAQQDFAELVKNKKANTTEQVATMVEEDVSVISANTSKAIDIILARVKVPLKELVQSVNTLDAEPFTETLLSGLLANYPADDELEAIGHRNTVKLVPEIFYKEAIKVPRFKSKLIILHLQATLYNITSTLVPNINKLISGCKILLTDKSVYSIFRISLGVVNILNAGTVTREHGV